MKPWMRTGLAIVAGIVVASLCVMGVEAAGHAALSGEGAFAAAVAGLGLGAFAGGMVAARIGRSTTPAWVVGLLLGVLSLINVFSFSHPMWFVPAAAFALGLATALAARMSPRVVA